MIPPRHEGSEGALGSARLPAGSRLGGSLRGQASARGCLPLTLIRRLGWKPARSVAASPASSSLRDLRHEPGHGTALLSATSGAGNTPAPPRVTSDVVEKMSTKKFHPL